ncbi:MAG: flavodoxin-dependent (E)-4-hydroxy-3-methylbut-2-enyl-diphosphate synthase, partial [Candidatus Omnitrophica bacterium]|nr:flavodoxin-dependent (E)-4-hydroxy-3-methylbut-2-enyl-diphosphate synthase [Candidatus Omnitrophota bacterium]
NGPGEAHESDFGITGGKEKGMIYVDGKQERVVSEEKLVDQLFEEIKKKKQTKSNSPSPFMGEGRDGGNMK